MCDVDWGCGMTTTGLYLPCGTLDHLVARRNLSHPVRLLALAASRANGAGIADAAPFELAEILSKGQPVESDELHRSRVIASIARLHGWGLLEWSSPARIRFNLDRVGIVEDRLAA